MNRPSRRAVATLLSTLLALGSALLAGGAARAATPKSGTIGPVDGAKLAWDYGAVGPGARAGQPVDSQCVPAICEDFPLTIAVPGGALFYAAHHSLLTIRYTWTSTVQDDMDVLAIAPDGSEAGPGTPDDANAGDGLEVLKITDPAPGLWHILSNVGATPVPTTAHAEATLSFSVINVKAFIPPVLAPDAPRFQDVSPSHDYQSIDFLDRQNAGEPSLGVNWKTGAVMYMAGTQISRITFNDNVTPAKATWTDVTPAVQAQVNEDEALFVDHTTGRTWAAGLLLATSNATFSDDDGATWTSGQGGPSDHSPDHETIGAGPYASPAPPTAGAAGYPKAVYYCSQAVAAATCGRSDDGGLTYNPGTALFPRTQPCATLHGHVKVSPDGTVYVPNGSCTNTSGNSAQGLAVSKDNGLTWTYSMVPGSPAGNNHFDPSLGIGNNNTVYFGFQRSDGHPMINVSHDHGASWNQISTDVGTDWGIKNMMWAEVVAGDDDRAAFAFLGSQTPGDATSTSFKGSWDMYVAFTYDGGRSWTTVDATPGDPVQRGCISGSYPCRNMLDFNDATVDKDGRVLIAFTDGCADTDKKTGSLAGGPQGEFRGPSKCDSNPNSFKPQDHVSFDGLVRQSCGKGLFATKDPGFTAGCPTRPSATLKVLGSRKTRAAKPAGAALPSTGVGSFGWLALMELAGAVLIRRWMHRTA